MSTSRTPTASRPPPGEEPTRGQSGDPRGAPARPRAPEDADSGLVLGRYRLRRRLGAGAFGTVWSARDERLDRDVAVKVLPRERVASGRFEREARATARLSHPGIVTLYEAAVDDDGAYLVSELVSGRTLAELIEEGRLSDRDVAELAVALCDGLAHAHAQGVIHRDVKPSNVLVPARITTPAGLAKLTDFGVARLTGGDSLTRTGDVVGTAGYMAPEQAEGLAVGPPADLYSLALVIYEALTGVNPVRAGSAAQRSRRLGAYLPPLRRHRRDLPRELGRAVDLALRPRPKERGSIAELRRALVSTARELDDAPSLVERAESSERDEWRAGTAEGWVPEFEGSRSPARPARGLSVASAAARMIAADTEAPLPLSGRLLAGLCAGGIAGWMVGIQLRPAPAAPVAVALAVGITVAVLPRLGWVAAGAAGAIALVVRGAAGDALLTVAAALLPMLLLARHPPRWPLAALAPALGAIGLAGAWPALAARAPSPWQRASLGAIGWVWLQLASALAGSSLYVHLPVDALAPAAWTSSPGGALNAVVGRLLSSGVFTPALVWGAGAMLLPVLLRQRDLVVRSGLVTLWAASLLGVTVLVLSLGPNPAAIGTSDAVLGVVAASLAGLLAGARGRASDRLRPADASARLA